jgi:hypothetical protein
MTDLIGGAEERAAIQLATSTWLTKRGDEKFILRGLLLRKRGDERSFGDHVNRERRRQNDFSYYVDRREEAKISFSHCEQEQAERMSAFSRRCRQ